MTAGAVAAVVIAAGQDGSSLDPSVFPPRGTGGSHPVVTQVLRMKGIEGCEEYSHVSVFPHEFSVACWSPSGEPTYYNVFTLHDREDVMPIYP